MTLASRLFARRRCTPVVKIGPWLVYCCLARDGVWALTDAKGTEWVLPLAVSRHDIGPNRFWHAYVGPVSVCAGRRGL